MKQIGIWLGITIIFLAGIWGLIALVNNNNSSDVLSSQITNLPPVSKDDIVAGDPQKAKTTLIEYADFQCPACANYSPIVRQLEKDFGDKLLIVYRFFPLPQHKNAMISAQAGYAAGKQNKFWEMSDLLYENQSTWADSSSAQDIFTSYAKKLGLNISQFATDLNSETGKRMINDQKNAGASVGINSTPTFFINSKKIANPRSYEAFKQLIQDEINNQ